MFNNLGIISTALKGVEEKGRLVNVLVAIVYVGGHMRTLIKFMTWDIPKRLTIMEG